jgi:L,D-peptidoglycan transpeptidase YkuD (ErfK/YbiS/YcfS/YnhG family)
MSSLQREVKRWDNSPQMVHGNRTRTVGLMRTVSRALVISTVMCVALTLTSFAPAAATQALPDSLTHIENAQQVIVVTAPTWASTRGTLTAWERTSSGWRKVVNATPALLGSRGMAPAATRRQATGTTPAGTFAITSAFGRRADPGAQLPYRQLTTWDAWPYNPTDPSTYNVFQDAKLSWDSYGRNVEHLWDFGMQYDYVAVLDYNLPQGPVTTDAKGIRRASQPANTSAGGGIFLHVSNGRTTAGCIAVSRKVMRTILRWLKPDAHPVIVVGPQDAITQM